MVHFTSFSGIVRSISDFPISNDPSQNGCNKMMSVDSENGETVNFVVAPNTYFVDRAVIYVGDHVTGYYDWNAPAPLIFPPQYRALIVVKYNPYSNVKVDYFNSQLISSDGQLKLNLGPDTQMVLTNGQPFLKNPVNRNLIVIYGISTRSIPAQTTPYEIIVWCG